jgi:enoyl-CoA hydratase
MHTVDSLVPRLSSLKWLRAESFAGNFALRLTINRPDALNALNPEVIRELSQAFSAVAESQCRCLVITGAGEKAFVAGADIKAMTAMSPQEANHFAEQGQKTFRQLELLACPTIAQINGFALGGGLELAMSCDILLASEKAKLGLPEVSLGLIPGFGGTQRLARAVGLMKAREMIFSGGFFTATEARDMGLINQVYAPDQLAEQTEKLVVTLTQRGPLALRKAKQAVLGGWDLSLDEGLKLEARLFAELFASEDQKEGTQAFVEKRAPIFTGK